MHDYSKQDMIAALAAAGIAPGDTVLFYVSLGFLGRPEGVAGQEALNSLFLDCCREALGAEGTMLVPTYSYSFCRGESFNPRTTPTTLGPFPEFFRTQPGMERSVEPILSVCGSGPATRTLFHDLPPTSYGADSLYARLVAAGAKICTVGLQMHWATFRHHIEEMEGVPFRYRKYFSGDLVDETGGHVHTLWKYSVRLWSEQANPDGRKLAQMLADDGVSRSAPLGRGRIFCVRADDYYAYAAAKFKHSPWLSAAGPPDDALDLELRRIPREDFGQVPRKDAALHDLGAILAPLPRYCVSDAYDFALECCAEQLPLTVHEFRTGAECAGILIPERWSCKKALLATSDGGTLFSLADTPLHAVFGTRSYNGEVTCAELLQHLHTASGSPDEVPCVCNTNADTWGLCCSENQRKMLTQERYTVQIEADMSLGLMRVGEAVTPGAQDGPEIVVYADLARPCQFNSGLSGVLAGISLVRELQKSAPRSTLRFLIVPGEIGLVAWLQANTVRGGIRLCIELDRLAGAGELTLTLYGAADPDVLNRLEAPALGGLPVVVAPEKPMAGGTAHGVRMSLRREGGSAAGAEAPKHFDAAALGARLAAIVAAL